jgi:putative flippase GtrA
MRRWPAFMTVGLLGFIVQLSALWALTSLAHWSWLPATVMSVELAVLHNYFWHEQWTWGDRTAAASRPLARVLRFHMSNGLVSMAGNAALMAVFVERFALAAIPANVLAVGALAVANFVMADRWVFSGSRRALKVCTAIALLTIPAGASAAPPADTLLAWERYVSATEANIARSRTPGATGRGVDGTIAASGESIHVASGTISDWRGSVFIPGISLDRLLDGLQHPGTPPPQEDVVSSSVIGRDVDSLRVAIRLVRQAIVTVRYDTEHHMQFRRVTPALATARSVATRIEQVGGGDHGFLWRLHSYWRYEEIDGGVRVDLQSLTLSRNVPALVRPMAAPLVNRIARESMFRTLEALRRYMSSRT